LPSRDFLDPDFTNLNQQTNKAPLQPSHDNSMADSFDTLVKVLRERDITYDSDEIKAAFENPKSQTAIQTWMQEYLSPETLLTKEEAAL